MPLKNDPGCTLCKLHKTANTVCLLSRDQPSDVMIIGEAPGAQEDETGVPFVGRSGRLLDASLAEAGIKREDAFVANAVSCRPPENKTPTKAQIRSCQVWLQKQIDYCKPKFVLLLGNTPLQSITGAPGIKAQRGKPFEKDGILYMPTYHPAFVLRDIAAKPAFMADLRAFARIIERGEVPREESLRPHVVRNSRDVDKMLEAMEGDVSFDIETTCLYPWQKYDEKGQPKPARINMIGFGTSSGEFSLPMPNMPECPWSDEAIDDIIYRITKKIESGKVRLITHNGKFDFLWMLVHYGVEWYRFVSFDTMLAHYLLDENDRHGLKYLAMKFLGAPDWDMDKESKQANNDLDKLVLYHAHDLYYTRELKRVFLRMLRKDEWVLRVFRKIMMPCVELFVEVEFDGVHVNVNKMDDAERFLRDAKATAEKNLSKWGDINWGSANQLRKLLFDTLDIPVVEVTKTGTASTSESVLKRIDHECVGDLLKFREAKQQLSFFIDGWKPFLHWKYEKGVWEAYLHPSFKLHGTVTGRLSCENPNLQQVPRDERIRSLIGAPDGWTLVECDLSQIELRIAAELANERRMIHAFLNDIDVHWLTAISEISRSGALKELVIDTARTWKQDKTIRYAEAIEALLEMGPDAAAEINKEWKEYRKKAKAVNFGYLYGMWWKKFKIYARDSYGVTIDDKQAQDSRISFFENYSDYPKWHERQRKFARRNGFVRSLSGRKRRLPAAMLAEDTPARGAAERQAINSPVQSFANELNLMAALQLRKEFGRHVVRICGTVHDAILLRVKDSHVSKVTRRLLEIMSRPQLLDDFEIVLKVPVLAEAKVGPWGAGISLEKWEKRNV